jgi:hypothetical protein
MTIDTFGATGTDLTQLRIEAQAPIHWGHRVSVAISCGRLLHDTTTPTIVKYTSESNPSP